MIRVLQVVGKMRRAGQETFLMNVYRNIDAEKVQFDFLVHTREECAYDAEILERGGHIYHIKRVQENPLFYLRDIARVVREHHYDIVQCHTAHAMGCLVLLGAWLGGASVRILHSHSTRAYPIWLHRLIRPFAYRLAGYHLACSQAAGEWMYGAKRKFQIIYSGIDTGQYCYDEECRKHIRRQLGLDEKIVVGHIGRLNRYKNYDFYCRYLLRYTDRILKPFSFWSGRERKKSISVNGFMILSWKKPFCCLENERIFLRFCSAWIFSSRRLYLKDLE